MQGYSQSINLTLRWIIEPLDPESAVGRPPLQSAPQFLAACQRNRVRDAIGWATRPPRRPEPLFPARRPGRLLGAPLAAARAVCRPKGRPMRARTVPAHDEPRRDRSVRCRSDKLA
jgi:hypothetical protein